ncbi:BspA family leucine-rich repeat surface protein [Lactobacillus amylovorus]|uniref:BspA family leucine-rich repeat surface protein n=1 Tax=Lactobacillus amylovorus TaxID=1604 RepID=UPI0023303FCC|nr:BspA family leucine-rich repeat surface protein [Lactobacillus amylovorus]MDB6252927.1 BspA family leucine-rich repeat surface protein [Lactobacillus amylovorus]
MLSKNNFNEKIRQMDEKKERFSIRKLTVGAASVLIGLTFIGVSGQTVHADTVPAAQNEEVAPKATTTDDTIKTADDSAVKITTETPVSSTKETDAQTQSTTKTSDQTVSTDVKNAASETEVKTETETAKKVEKDLTKTAPDEETEKTVAEDVASKTTDAKDTTTLKTDQKAALAKDLAAQKTAAPVQKNYNTTDWDGNLDNTTHEYTLTGYHGEDKENIYIPNTDDFIKAGTISDTDKVYITKDLIQTITRAGAESITIDDQGSDDKNKVYAKGDWSNAFNSSTLKKADLKHLDTSGVTNLSMAFANMPNIKSIDLSGVDLSHATNIDNMFYNNPNLESVNLSGVKFGNVRSANAVFYGDAKLTDVDMSGVDLSHVNGANAWFMGDSNLTTVDFSNVTFPDKFTNTFAHADGKLKNVNLTGAKNVPASILKAYVKALGNSGATSIDLRGINFDRVIDLSGWFANMPNIKSIDLSGVDLSHATNIDNMFYNNPNLESVNLSGVKFGNVTKANAVFYGDAKLTDVDMSGVDLSHVNGANAWFMGDSNLTTVDFSNVTFPDKFTNTFAHADGKLKNVNLTGAKNVPASILKAYVKALGNSGATSIDLRGINFDRVIDLSGWFANMPNIKSIDLSGVDLSHATNIDNMFYNNPNLESVNLSGVKFGNVTKANAVFYGDAKLTDVDMSGVDLSHVNGANAWFMGDSNLTTVDFSNVTFPDKFTNTFAHADGKLKNVNLTGAKNVPADFLRAYVKSEANSGATSIDVSNFDLNKNDLSDLSGLFTNMPNLKEVNVTGLVTDKVENVSRMFYNDSALTTIVGLDTWDTSNVTDMSYIFASFTNPTTDNHKPQGLEHTGSLKALDLSGWKTSNVTNMACMFTGQNHLETLKGLSNWNTSKVTNMAQMFHGLSKLQDGSLGDLSKWDTSNVTDMTYMFAVMSLQTDLSFVNGWKTGMVTDMSYMFAKDEKLQKLDLSNWDVSSVGLKETEQNYSFGAMFSGDTALTSVGDISHWRTDNVHDTRQMFYGTTSLKNIDLSGWNTGKLQIAEGMFWNSGAQYINLDHWDFSNIKRLDDYGFVKAQGELSGVENMFADLTNNAVVKMDGIVLPDANTVFVVTDFRGYHPIAVIANGKNGESLADLVKLNKQTWTDKNNQTVLGRQNTNKLVFFDADDLTKKVGIEGLNFIFDSEKDLADQFNTAIGEDAVKKAIGSLASKWDVQRDTENGKLKPALRLNNITPAAFVALLAVNGDPTEKVPEEVSRDIAMVYAQYKLHFIKDSNPGSGTTSDEKPNPDNHPTDNNGKNDDHHGDNVAPHGENKPQANHKKDDKKKSKTISPKAMEKAKNNRGSVKKLGAVKTATKNNVVKAATKTAPKAENTLPQTGEKQNNLALFGLGLLSLFGLGSFVDRKRRN